MSTTFLTASNSAELYAALAKCAGGETILLEGGNYGKLSLTYQTKFDFDFPSNVTIVPKDPSNPAVFTGMDVRGAGNITFDGITFDYTYKAGDTITTRPFSFQNCENLTIRDSTFDGDVASGVTGAANGYAAGTGLMVRDSTGTLLEGNEFSGFQRGVYMDSNQNTTIRGNEVHSMRMDGMSFSNMDGIVIEENYFHDFRGSPNSGDHCDFIQFWTSQTTSPSTNITIRDNVLDIGEGSWTQSIFMRNEEVDWGNAGTEMYYQNVLIENNTITNAHTNGINVGQTTGLTIRNNTVVHSDGDSQDGNDHAVEIPGIVVHPKSTGVTVTENVVGDLSGLPKVTGWNVSNNVIVQDQDPFKANYYGDVFVSSTLGLEDGRHEFVVRPGSAIDLADVGSDRMQGSAEGLNVTFHVEKTDVATKVFDASTSNLNGQVLPSGTTYLWTFGDGTTAEGATISHSFTGSGVYDVELLIRLPNGQTSTETMKVKVQSAEILSLSDDGHFIAYHDGVEVGLSDLANHTADGLQLGAKGVAASVGRSHVLDVVGSDDMSIAFTVGADTAGASGELFRLQGSFYATVTSSGEVQFRLYEQDGSEVWITTKGAKINNGADHDVVISLADDRLQIWVDGGKLADVSATGVVGGATGYNSHNLVFGNPWNGTNFAGDLTAFEVAVGAHDFPATPTTTVLSPTPAELYPTKAVMEEVVQDVELLRLDADGHFVAYQDKTSTDLSDLANHTADGLQLGAKGVAASVGRSHVLDVVGSDDMSIAFTVGADTAGASGELFRLQGSFSATVTTSGEVQFRLFHPDGSGTNFTTNGANVANGENHDVVVQLADDKLQIWVDGAKLAEGSAPGVVAGASGYGSHNLVFGNPWGKANFAGDLSAFEISVGAESDSSKPAGAALAETTASNTMEDPLGATFSTDEGSDRFEFMSLADLSAMAA